MAGLRKEVSLFPGLYILTETWAKHDLYEWPAFQEATVRLLIYRHEAALPLREASRGLKRPPPENE